MYNPGELPKELLNLLFENSTMMLKDMFLRVDERIGRGESPEEVFRYVLKDAMAAVTPQDMPLDRLCKSAIMATATIYLYRAVTEHGVSVMREDTVQPEATA